MPMGPLSGPLKFLMPALSWRAEALSHWHPQSLSQGPRHSVSVCEGYRWMEAWPGWQERLGRPLALRCPQAPRMNATFVLFC